MVYDSESSEENGRGREFLTSGGVVDVCSLPGGAAVHGAERTAPADHGSRSRRALQRAQVRRESAGASRRRRLLRRSHVADRLPDVPHHLRQRPLHRLHARRPAGYADRAQRASDGRPQGRPPEAAPDAERAPAARQQRHARTRYVIYYVTLQHRVQLTALY